MAEFPYMPLWTDALLGDCGSLSDADFGLYVKLLIQMWRAQDGLLPDDDAWLARRFGRSVEDIQRDMRPLIKQYCQRRNGMITQRRLQSELIKVRQKSAKQSEKAKLRWDKEKGLSRGNALAMPTIAIQKEERKQEAGTLARPTGERPSEEEGKREEASGKTEDIPVSSELASRFAKRSLSGRRLDS